MKRMFFLTILAILLFSNFTVVASAQDKTPILYFFYGRECPHCKKLEPEMDKLVNQFKGLKVEKHEVWYNLTSRKRFIAMAAERGKKAEGVPTIIIGGDMYLGTDITRVRAIISKYYPKK